jgi:TonB family protein
MNVVVQNKRTFEVRPPSVIAQIPPDYPIEMRKYGLRGTVVIDFIATKEGNVQNPYVLESTNPAFEEPAVRAVMQWKFRPAAFHGIAVAAHMRVPVVFQLEPGGLHGEGADLYSVNVKSSSKGYQPPRIRNLMLPLYPTDLRRDKIAGSADADCIVDTHGRVIQVKIKLASRPEFAGALTAALEAWAFYPALQDGKPVLSTVHYSTGFSMKELPDDDAYSMLRLEEKHPERILSAAALDGIPRPISQRPPRFPDTMVGLRDSGSALIDFIIDSDGHARLPRVVEATDPAFGYAAAQAVSTWFFEPPRAHGDPVTARLRMPFEFHLPQLGN